MVRDSVAQPVTVVSREDTAWREKRAVQGMEGMDRRRGEKGDAMAGSKRRADRNERILFHERTQLSKC